MDTTKLIDAIAQADKADYQQAVDVVEDFIKEVTKYPVPFRPGM